jgi:hypothetical protein
MSGGQDGPSKYDIYLAKKVDEIKTSLIEAVDNAQLQPMGFDTSSLLTQIARLNYTLKNTKNCSASV